MLTTRITSLICEADKTSLYLGSFVGVPISTVIMPSPPYGQTTIAIVVPVARRHAQAANSGLDAIMHL